MSDDLPRWWQSGVIYQIYPRSFQDTNGDGIGDLAGIRRRLGYLQDLGIDAIWLSPIFVSPMKDFGYDVADYCAVDPRFGTMEDFDALVADARGCGIRIILDLVPNHTSDQHAWFQEARTSRTSAKRDWYLWADPAPNGGRPNNWLSEFGGPAWTFDEASGQYYYHAFLPEQPDLNWRNPAVRAAIYDTMRFWLRKGVAGFRVDVLWHLLKDEGYRDNPENPGWKEGMSPTHRLLPLYTTDLPDVQQIVREMRAVVDEFDERVLIGELYLPLERLVRYYGEQLDGAHLPFNFQLIEAPWHARELDRLVRDYESALPEGGWPNWVLGNHDKPRIAGRVGAQQARVAAMLLLTLRGTPTLYYGDEIGLPQADLSRLDVRDPFEDNVPGFGLGRDGCRTPMQWDTNAAAGFTTGTPWLPLASNDPTLTVASESGDPRSILSLYRRLIDLRKAHPALSIGRYHPLAAEGDLLVYLREHGSERFLIALNLGAEPASVHVGGDANGRVAASTGTDRDGEQTAATIDLRPADGLLIALE
jgi:alpha-glucosidase